MYCHLLENSAAVNILIYCCTQCHYQWLLDVMPCSVRAHLVLPCDGALLPASPWAVRRISLCARSFHINKEMFPMIKDTREGEGRERENGGTDRWGLITTFERRLDSSLPERLPLGFFSDIVFSFSCLKTKRSSFNSLVLIHQIKKGRTAEIDNSLRQHQLMWKEKKKQTKQQEGILGDTNTMSLIFRHWCLRLCLTETIS